MAASQVKSKSKNDFTDSGRERWSGNELVSVWSSMLFHHWPLPPLQPQKDWCCWAPSSDRQRRREQPGGPAAAASSMGTRSGSLLSSDQQAALQTQAWRRKRSSRRWDEARWQVDSWGGSPCQRRFWWCVERTAGSPSIAHWISRGGLQLLWWVSDRWRCKEKNTYYSASVSPAALLPLNSTSRSELSEHPPA